MELVIADDQGVGLDATVEVDPGSVVFHSRGGAAGSPNARNRDYSTALRLVLGRLLDHQITIEGAWVDSSRVQHLPPGERKILSGTDLPASRDTLFKLMSRRMQAVGRAPGAGAGRGNSNKRIRMAIASGSREEIIQVIGAIPRSGGSSKVSRLPAAQLQKVTPEHIWQAIAEMSVTGPGNEFGPSTDYDLLTDSGLRLPPKAVFGRAASIALGFPLRPGHFSAGFGMPCFDILQDAGYRIVKKEEGVEQAEALSEEDKVWAEGSPRLVTHLRRERGRGLAKAKKAEFIRKHGRLFCEKCKMDPKQVYGDEDGVACIEVHHHATEVAKMPDGHETRLEDLQCLCANCHRYVHRVMKR